MRNYSCSLSAVKLMLLVALVCALAQSANAQSTIANAVASIPTPRYVSSAETATTCVQQITSPTPRASYLAFEAIAVNNKDFSYRPSVGFRGSGGFALPAGLYLHEEIETATEFKLGPVASGEGRYFASRTTVERDVAAPTPEISISALAGIDVAHFANKIYGKTAVRFRGGLSARSSGSTRMPRVQGSLAAIVPVSDQNKLWGVKTTIDGFYDLPHTFIGLTGGAEATLANAKASFTPHRHWAGVFGAHAGIFINLSAIAGY